MWSAARWVVAGGEQGWESTVGSRGDSVGGMVDGQRVGSGLSRGMGADKEAAGSGVGGDGELGGSGGAADGHLPVRPNHVKLPWQP